MLQKEKEHSEPTTLIPDIHNKSQNARLVSSDVFPGQPKGQVVCVVYTCVSNYFIELDSNVLFFKKQKILLNSLGEKNPLKMATTITSKNSISFSYEFSFVSCFCQEARALFTFCITLHVLDRLHQAHMLFWQSPRILSCFCPLKEPCSAE